MPFRQLLCVRNLAEEAQWPELGRWTPDIERAVQVRGLGGVIVSYSWAKQFITPTVPLSTQMYQWVIS